MTVAQPCPTWCGRTVRDGQLMCARCWAKVPQAIKNAVNNTWRKAKNTGLRDEAAMLDYKAAREAALASVR